MQIKLVTTITKWCIWACRDGGLFFRQKNGGKIFWVLNSWVQRWKGNALAVPIVGHGAEIVTLVLLEPQSPDVICSSLKKISPANANDAANKSVKLCSWCFSGVIRQHVCWSLKRFPPRTRAGSQARSDGGDTAGSMKAGVAAGENPFPEWAFCRGRYADLSVIW